VRRTLRSPHPESNQPNIGGAIMKNVLVGMLLASVFIVPAEADNNHQGPSGGSGGAGSGSAPTSSSTATANGGAGGAGGIGTGGSATGGTATGGTATGGTGGAATGGKSSASGNSSTVTVSLTNTGSSTGSSGSSGSNGTASGSAAGDPNAATTVKYDGSYTVKSAPPIAAPSLTSTFSDTCMGSSSFGLSFVGFGATGGTTMVDEACVRRLDSREFRAMGLNDVALALLCQSPANRKAVEAAGRACPSASAPSDTAAATATTTAVVTVMQPVQPMSSDRKDLAPVEPQASLAAPVVPAEAPPPVKEQPAAAAPQQASLTSEATAEPVPAQEHAEAVEIKPLSDEVDVK
jgi:hypothetical protein